MKYKSAIALSAFLFLGIGACTPEAKPTPTYTSPSPKATAIASTPTVYSTPFTSDFTIELTELKRSCAGVAGCNVTCLIQLRKVKGNTYDPNKEYKLVYVIEGATKPYSNYVLLKDGRYTHNDYDKVTVKDEQTKLTVRITEITGSN